MNKDPSSVRDLGIEPENPDKDDKTVAGCLIATVVMVAIALVYGAWVIVNLRFDP